MRQVFFDLFEVLLVRALRLGRLLLVIAGSCTSWDVVVELSLEATLLLTCLLIEKAGGLVESGLLLGH